jgi:hypothetical protein
MAAEQFNSQGIERGSNRGNLVQDIDAIPVLLDHALDTGDLTGYAICPAPDTLHGAAIHAIYIYQVYVYGKLVLQVAPNAVSSPQKKNPPGLSRTGLSDLELAAIILVIHAAHSAHASRAACRYRLLLLGKLGHKRLGGEQQTGDRRSIL